MKPAVVVHRARCELIPSSNASQTAPQPEIDAEAEAEIDASSRVLAVPADELTLLTRRSLPILRVSAYVQEGLNAAVAQGGGSARRLRRNSQALTERLKEQSRSTTRGGVRELSLAESGELLRGTPRKGKPWKSAARQIRFSGVLDISEEAEDQFDEAWPVSEDAQQHDNVAYNSAESFGYAAARLPGCYAVAWRVFDEIALRLPGFNPAAMLDFGAGPGTAIWAATDVWEDHPMLAHAIEPSPSMRWIGLQIEQQFRLRLRENSDEAQPSDSGLLLPESEAADVQLGASSGLPVESNDEEQGSPGVLAAEDDPDWSEVSASGSPEGKEGSLPGKGSAVLAGRSIRWLQHLQGYRDRKGLARKSKTQTTWVQSTGGRRYDLVVASYSLGELPSSAEQRRALRALWEATADVLVLIEPGTPSGSGLVRAARAQVLRWETDAQGSRGAHVVAPCPHDGRCPMDGQPTWCHFSQKLERTDMQRRAKLRANRPAPRSHQDERFSYIVLRRGPRPPIRAELALPEQLDWLEAAERRRQAEERSEQYDELPEGMVEEDEHLQQLIEASIHAGDDEEDDEELTDGESVGSDAAEDLRPSAGSMDASKSPLDWRRVSHLELEHTSVREAAAANSGLWSRIVRPPRRRARHSMFTICSAAGPEEDRAAAGKLQQQIVSEGDKLKWLGALGLRLVKRLDWGDLWPSYLQRNAKKGGNGGGC